MRTTRLLTTTAAALTGAALLAAPAAAGGPEFEDPSQLPPPPSMTVSDATGYEADGSMAFTVTLSKPAPAGMVISHSVTHEDTDGADFLPVFADGIGAGDTEYTIHVGLAGDDGVEDVENFVLHVENNVGYEVHNSAADGFILDGNGPQLEIVDASAPEGDPGDDNHIDVVVQASYAPLEDLTFRLYSGAYGFEAVPGEDYEHIDQIVTLPAGQTTVSTPLPIIEDLLDEPTELLPVFGGDESAGDFGLDGGSATLRILDDDEPGDGGDGGAEPGDAGPSATTTSSTTPDVTPVSADGASEVLGDETAQLDADLTRSDDERSVGWIIGALALATAIVVLLLVAARRRRRPAHLRP